MTRVQTQTAAIFCDRLATFTHIPLLIWNLIILTFSIIVVARVGNDPKYFNANKLWVNSRTLTAMVFLWCTIPTLVALVSTVDLLRRKTINARRVVFSASFGATLYAVGFFIWGDCAYLGWNSICWTGGWRSYVRTHDPEILRYFLPWFALVTGLAYAAIAISAMVALRRQHHAAAERSYQQHVIRQKRLSIDSSEIGTSTIGDQTLPSRPRSNVPSRPLSLANHSTRPPTYYSSTDASLLTVDEKDEKGGSFGYV